MLEGEQGEALLNPGEQGGTALADILFGNVNPSGKLPVTFYQSTEDLPPFDDYSMEGRTYKFFQGEPLFPFGFGLSYTTFDILEVKWEHHHYGQGDKIHVELTVQNTGNQAGEEVVMIFSARENLYYYEPVDNESSVIGSLVGYQRVKLKPGEIKTIAMSIDLQDLHHWNTTLKKYTVEKGVYHFGLSPDLDQSHLGYLCRIKID